MTSLFNTILYKPLFNGLVVLYQTIAFRDLGVAIILLTVVVRIVLYPLFHKTAKHQRITQQLQPEIKKIKEKYKNNKEAQTKATIELYQKYNVNPLTPLFLLLLQLPVLFALYRIFINGFSNGSLDMLYSFVPRPEEIPQIFLHLIPLSEVSIPIVIIAVLAQYFQGKLTFAKSKQDKANKETTQAQLMARIGVFIGPVITLVILLRFPAAVALYWLTTTIFSIKQQTKVNKAIDIEKSK